MSRVRRMGLVRVLPVVRVDSIVVDFIVSIYIMQPIDLGDKFVTICYRKKSDEKYG